MPLCGLPDRVQKSKKKPDKILRNEENKLMHVSKCQDFILFSSSFSPVLF